jgi:hypothetical protein
MKFFEMDNSLIYFRFLKILKLQFTSFCFRQNNYLRIN